MNDRVGTHIPSAAEVAAIIDEIEKIRARLARATVDLTTDERRHALRFRPGGEPIVELVTSIAKRESFTLPRIDLDGITRDLTLANRIRPLVEVARSLVQTLEDTLLEAHSECWQGTTAYYTALARAAETDGQLATELVPVVEFFATGKRKTQEPPSPPPPPKIP